MAGTAAGSVKEALKLHAACAPRVARGKIFPAAFLFRVIALRQGCLHRQCGIRAAPTGARTRLVLSHRAAGMSVETTPSPAARYSRVFSGKLARLKADSAYGVMPTP